MDFSKALTYPFDDEDWVKKLGIAAAIGLIAFVLSAVLIGFVAMIPLVGWSIETIKRVRANEPKPLAGWDDFGGMFSKGLTPFLAALVYQIPTLLIYCVAFGVFFLPVLGGKNSDASAALGGVAMIIFYCCICLVLLYALAAGVVYWGGLMRYLDKPEFGTFMQFGDNIALVRAHSGDFGMAFLFILLGSVVASVVAGIPCIGWAVYMPFSFYYSSHILGQLAQKVTGGGAMASAAPQV
jgi:hypothetical protein